MGDALADPGKKQEFVAPVDLRRKYKSDSNAVLVNI